MLIINVKLKLLMIVNNASKKDTEGQLCQQRLKGNNASVVGDKR